MAAENLSEMCVAFHSERQSSLAAERQGLSGAYVVVPPTDTEIFKRAYAVAPSAAQVLLAYFYRSRVTKSDTVQFTKHLAQRFGLDPSHARRTVNKLVEAEIFERVENGKKSITVRGNWPKRATIVKRS